MSSLCSPYYKVSVSHICVYLLFKQEPFDPEEFVERLAWRTVADSRNEGTGHFDPVLLHETFLQAIK
jgi:hypothetical protein